jgi:hypothetical protein
MRTRWLQLTVALSGLASATGAGAQFSTTYVVPALVDTGARVRVSVASGVRQTWPLAARVHRFQATVRAISAETLYVEVPNTVGRVAVPRGSIRWLEVSLGRPSRWEKAIEVGLVCAVIFGARLRAAHEDPETRQFNAAWKAVAVGAGIGFAAGVYFGGRQPSERWAVARLRELGGR